MSRILAVVVSFHPDSETAENIKALLCEVHHVVVVDNESNPDSHKLFSIFPETAVSVISNQENRGVAEGFNQGIRWGLVRDFQYFLLMDQDSCPKPGMVNELLRAKGQSGLPDELLLLGPHHEASNRPLQHSSSQNIEKVSLLITSGSLLSRGLVQKFGLYDEKLFIDHVDHDYCIRIARGGGTCLKVHSAVLIHKFGRSEVRRFLGKTFFLQDYSPFRRYHMMRNRLILYKRYGAFFEKWFWLDLRSAIKDLVKLILFEPNKGPKLAAVARGIRDGLKWRD